MVSVVKTKLFPGELPVVAPGLRLVGKYLIVSAGAPPKVTFSEHIRDRDRRLLLTSLSLKYKDRGLGIHWRSSSSAAPLEELGRELQELAAKAEALYNEVSAGKLPKGEIVTEGEGVALVDLPLTAKVELDRLRSAVVPTALYHHALKSGEELLSSLVDFAERVMEGAGVGHEEMGGLLLDFVVSKLAESHSVTVYHVKPDGEVVRMRAAGPPTVHRLPGGRFRIVLTRRIAGKGTYDGLGVPKEEGDYAETVIELGRWHVIHRYYSRDGELKGTYININTPPEVTLTGIKYYDLYVDVVQVPGERKRVVDEDRLEEVCREGVLSRSLCERAREEARRLVEGDA
ncbi:TPA: DUF402 domain-containing protein [Candidatus Micrarchaeota archaeon]|nr:DUF402 domain-containing protein [Candidatus Micrarchaeota archaeon]